MLRSRRSQAKIKPRCLDERCSLQVFDSVQAVKTRRHWPQTSCARSIPAQLGLKESGASGSAEAGCKHRSSGTSGSWRHCQNWCLHVSLSSGLHSRMLFSTFSSISEQASVSLCQHLCSLKCRSTAVPRPGKNLRNQGSTKQYVRPQDVRVEQRQLPKQREAHAASPLGIHMNTAEWEHLRHVGPILRFFNSAICLISSRCTRVLRVEIRGHLPVLRHQDHGWPCVRTVKANQLTRVSNAPCRTASIIGANRKCSQECYAKKICFQDRNLSAPANEFGDMHLSTKLSQRCAVFFSPRRLGRLSLIFHSLSNTWQGSAKSAVLGSPELPSRQAPTVATSDANWLRARKGDQLFTHGGHVSHAPSFSRTMCCPPASNKYSESDLPAGGLSEQGAVRLLPPVRAWRVWGSGLLSW